MKKLVILDHFLMDIKGHEETYDFAIAKEAIRQGIKTEIWCPKREKPQPEFVKQCLKQPFWKKKNLLKMIFAAMMSIFEWRSIFKNNKLDQETTVFVQSVRLPILLFFSLGTLGIKLEPRVIIVLRRGLREYNKLLLRCLYKKGNVLFYADSEAIVNELLSNGISSAKLLPMPHLLLIKRVQSQDNKIAIGYFGGARFDKGFDLLPKVIERVLQNHPQASFIIQAYDYKQSDEIKRAKNAIFSIQNKYPKRIKMLKIYLSESEYKKQMKQCSILLAPCRREFYGEGTSGILAEAISGGVWAVVPSKTWMSAQKSRYDKISTFDEYATEDISGAIDYCLSKEKGLDTKRIDNQISSWLRFHSASNFLKVVSATKNNTTGT